MKTKEIAYALLTGFILMWAIFTTGWLMTEKKMNKIMLKDINQKQRIIDSIGSEGFVKDIQIGRYELILDRIREVDSAIVDEAMKNTE